MEEAVNRYAREFLEAVSAAIARDPHVKACRARALEAGLDLRATFETRVVPLAPASCGEGQASISASRAMPPARAHEITAADRRFLRSLRIAADETPEAVE